MPAQGLSFMPGPFTSDLELNHLCRHRVAVLLYASQLHCIGLLELCLAAAKQNQTLHNGQYFICLAITQLCIQLYFPEILSW